MKLSYSNIQTDCVNNQNHKRNELTCHFLIVDSMSFVSVGFQKMWFGVCMNCYKLQRSMYGVRKMSTQSLLGSSVRSFQQRVT